MSLINRKYFAQYSPLPIPSNFDYSEIMLYEPVAIEIWVRPLIGDDLVDELEDQVKNNTLTPENSTLLTDGKLWQYLCYATCLEGLPFLWANISAVGITLGKSESSDSITLKDLTYIQQHLRNQVEFLKESVKRWLCERADSFPLLDQCGCGCDGCNKNKGLLYPNPNYNIYSTYRKNTNLK